MPSRFATIQSAIAAAADGDEVVVAPGTYREALDLLGKQITLRSSGSASATILDGADGAASILTATRGESVGGTIVRGFTFRNGQGTAMSVCGLPGRKGGAIFVFHAGLSVIDSVFEDNGARQDLAGGAIYGCDADLAVVTSRFERNVAKYGGAIEYVGTPARRLTVEHSTFLANESGQGGAIGGELNGSSSATIRGSRFDGNDGGHGGGVGLAAFNTSRLTIERCTFTNNGRGGTGGGVQVDLFDRTSFTMTRCRFDGNRASHGGGLMLACGNESKASVADCDFANGVASSGGGVHLHAAGSSTIDFVRAEIRGHEGGFGAGLFAVARGDLPAAPGGGTIRIDGVRFFDNVAHECCNTGIYSDSCFVDGLPPGGNGLYYGGGADVRTITGGAIVVANSLFAGNSGTRGGGAHASSCAGGTIDFVNTTIVDNDGAGIHTRFGLPRNAGLTGLGEIRVTNSIVRDNDAQQIAVEKFDARGAAGVRFSNIEGGFAGEQNIDLDPRFVDAANRDYRLSDGSLCIDAGDSGAIAGTLAADMTGRPRRVDDPLTPDTGRGPAPVVDLGAIEYQPGRRRAMRR